MQQKSLFLATKISLASEISFMSKKSLFYDFIFINIPYWSIVENVLLFTWFYLSIFSISRSHLWIEILFNLVFDLFYFICGLFQILSGSRFFLLISFSIFLFRCQQKFSGIDFKIRQCVEENRRQFQFSWHCCASRCTHGHCR